ncbi:hypothetical protein KC19_2G276600 [Ceratodon purpureus]|uniref:Uncharacterized protein n=1 Tax=Ceratodon purpureus TaxID=3225 RepID=A0A8T0J072_CERPU|nr:hypothetical protein KC19_2G276600 [Ceratodon purpureus]
MLNNFFTLLCLKLQLVSLPQMARSVASSLVLTGLFLVALWANAEAVVTVINSAMVPVDVETNGNHVTVQTGASPVYVDVKGSKEETVQVSTGAGKQPIFVDVKER